jgi:hypothetical protein
MTQVTRKWSWVHFFFGAAFSFFVSFITLSGWANSLNAHLLSVACVATFCGVIAGRFGNPAWCWIVRVLTLLGH